MLLLSIPRGLLTSFVASLLVFAFLLFGVTGVSSYLWNRFYLYRGTKSMPGYIKSTFLLLHINSIGYCSTASLERNTPAGNVQVGKIMVRRLFDIIFCSYNHFIIHLLVLQFAMPIRTKSREDNICKDMIIFHSRM
jgi:hypothetical protein